MEIVFHYTFATGAPISYVITQVNVTFLLHMYRFARFKCKCVGVALTANFVAININALFALICISCEAIVSVGQS